MSAFVSTVGQMLNGHVVGYVGVIGDAVSSQTFVGGFARTAVDGIASTTGKTAVPFTLSTSCGIASASKFLTALAAVQLLDGASWGTIDGTALTGLTLDSVMYEALPADWKIQDPGVKQITFRELLTHTSGLPEYPPPPGGEDYANLQNYICGKSVLPATPTTPPYGPGGPRYPVNYSNVGFALFRLLLPNVNAMHNPAHPWRDNTSEPVGVRAQAYANEYERIVADNVFGKVGVTGPTTGPPAGHTYAFGYAFPGSTAGIDQAPENLGLDAGPGAWFISINQLRPVLESLNNIDGKILTAPQWNHMQNIGSPAGFAGTVVGFGIDVLIDSGTGYRWVEKNGGYENQNASIAFFGSMTPNATTGGPYYAALFVNSDIWGGTGSVTGWYQCTQCDTLFFPSNGGVCPATGKSKKPHANWGEYILSTGTVPDGQSHWQQCAHCGALCYQASATDPSICPATGARHTPTGPTFNISQTGQSDLEHQAGWRWCKNCGVLAYSFGNPNAGVCAHGGPHQFILSDSNYALMCSYGPDTVLLQAFRSSI